MVASSVSKIGGYSDAIPTDATHVPTRVRLSFWGHVAMTDLEREIHRLNEPPTIEDMLREWSPAQGDETIGLKRMEDDGA